MQKEVHTNSLGEKYTLSEVNEAEYFTEDQEKLLRKVKGKDAEIGKEYYTQLHRKIKILYKEDGRVLFKDIDASLRIDVSENDEFFECHLFWLNGEPVYKGDVLYSKVTSDTYKVESFDGKYVTGKKGKCGGFFGFASLLTKNINESYDHIGIEVTEYEEVFNDPTAFKVGDVVKVVKKLEEKSCLSFTNWKNSWVVPMDNFLDKNFEITESDSSLGYRLGDSCFYFPSCVLELVKENAVKKTKLLQIYLDGKLIEEKEIEV